MLALLKRQRRVDPHTTAWSDALRVEVGPMGAEMTTMERAQFVMHEEAQARVLAAYRDEALFEQAKASLAERNAGVLPTPREQLVRK